MIRRWFIILLVLSFLSACNNSADTSITHTESTYLTLSSTKNEVYVDETVALSLNYFYACIDPNDHKLSKYAKLYHARQILSRLTLGEIAHECSSSSTHNA